MKVGEWLRRLATDNDEVEAEDLSQEVEASAEACPAMSCRQGDKVLLLGRLRCVDLRPTGSAPTLVAELYDGTDAVELIWLGRRTIAGIAPGRAMKVSGRIAVRGSTKVMYNPEYELLPANS